MRTVRVGEISDQVRGVTYRKADASSDHKDGYSPVLRAGNIGEFGLVYDDLVFVPDGNISKKQRIRRHDVVIAASSGSLNVVGKAAQALDHFPGAFGAFCKVLRPSRDVDPRYFGHFFRTETYRRIVSTLAAGANINNLRTGDLDDLQIPLPPIREQNRIAAILDAADALRTKRRESLEVLDELVQSVFLDMFGDPVTKSDGRFKTEPVSLGELARIRTGKLDANAADEDGAYPFFTCGKRTLRINEAAYEAKAVLVAGNGDLNVKYYEGKFNAYQRTYIIETRNEARVRPKFIYGFLDLYVAELRRKAIGGVIKYIKLPYLTEAVVCLPSRSAQDQFANCVDGVEKLRGALQDHLAELDTLFASLQSRAFRGEL